MENQDNSNNSVIIILTLLISLGCFVSGFFLEHREQWIMNLISFGGIIFLAVNGIKSTDNKLWTIILIVSIISVTYCCLIKINLFNYSSNTIETIMYFAASIFLSIVLPLINAAIAYILLYLIMRIIYLILFVRYTLIPVLIFSIVIICCLFAIIYLSTEIFTVFSTIMYIFGILFLVFLVISVLISLFSKT